MIFFPAIDLLGGRAVRLRAGKFEEATVYHDAPWELARDWEKAGATDLHLVDLDAAKASGSNAAVVRRIRDSTSLRIQQGGGLRSADAVARALAGGADRAVIGTLAVKAPAEAEEICRIHPGRIVVAVDARDGIVAVSGWTEPTDARPADLARRAAAWGAAAVLYTDVARDGLETGPDLDGTTLLARQAGLRVLASGGVATLADLGRLAAIRPELEGAVVGRALLEGRFTIEAALEACR